MDPDDAPQKGPNGEAVTLWWTRQDDQGVFHMGDYRDAVTAQEAIPACLGELLRECADEVERRGIRDGRFTVDPYSA
jgi:hypothetical protein